MSNNKIDHEAAKRYAAYIGDMARDHVCDQDDVNLSAAYLYAMAQLTEWEATARKLTNGLCSDREELEGFIEETISILKGELAPLEAQLDKATELLRDAIDQLERPDEMAQVVREEARVFLAKHKERNDGNQ